MIPIELRNLKESRKIIQSNIIKTKALLRNGNQTNEIVNSGKTLY